MPPMNTGGPERQRAAGHEPPLEELISDPIMGLLLRRDGLTADDVRRVIVAVRTARRPP